MLNENYENVPALLIGLGGIGSSIVDNVYGRLKETGLSENVEALVFDTDINSQKKLLNINPECKIQTSTDKTVKYALDNDPTAREWFPAHPLVEKMQMLNGAGQIRAVSRLALRSAMKAGKLNSVGAVKERLFKLGSKTNEKGIRVMVVSSMMGGTGSGMFLQIPLYIREVFESQFNSDKIEIQGTFILPDVLKGAITLEQTENVYANAYASMKELNAIIMSKAGDGSSIDLEYKPDQLNAAGMRDIAVKDWPYDYCYFYDKEDTKGRVLSGFDDYINMIENNLYLQVFGPISDRMYSNYINEIRGSIRENGRNIYGGIGSGELSYPYDDIVDLCVYRVLAGSLDNQLLKIDQIYRAEMDKYNRNIQNGIDTPMPEKENVYITNFESLSTTDNFFIKIKRDITEYDDKGDPVIGVDGKEVTNITKLKGSIDELAKSVLQNDEEIRNLAASCIVKSGSFTNLPPEKLKSAVSNCEARFREYRTTLESKVQNKADSKANADWGIYSETNKSILDEYLHSGETFINSVGIRYILYKLHKELKQQKLDLEEEIAKSSSNLKRAEEKLFKSAKGTDIDPVKKADEVFKSKGLFNKNVKNFKDDYESKSSKRVKALNGYAECLAKYYYYETSLQLMEVLIGEYENMFNRLTDQKYEIEKTINRLLTKHDDTKGTTNLYVLGNHIFKEQIWKSIPDDVKSSVLSDTLSEEMHKALFGGFQKKVNNAVGQVVSYDKLFHDLIFKSCREHLLSKNSVKETLDINIMQALEREADFSGQSSSRLEYIKAKITELADSVCPWTPQSERSSDFNIWGISDECRSATESPDEESTLSKMIKEASAGKMAATNVEQDKKHVLSKRSIYFVTSRYGLMVSDFSKFAAGKNDQSDGEYFVAYNSVIKSLIAKRAVTPHIDKRWHTTLRDINDEVYKKNIDNIAKAFVVGIANGNFKVLTTGSAPAINRFVSQFGGSASVINYQSEPINDKIKSLYNALSSNPDLVEKVLSDYFEPFVKHARANVEPGIDIATTEFVAKMNKVKLLGYDKVENIIDVFVNYLLESGENGNCDSLLQALYGIVDTLAEAYSLGGIESRKYNSAAILASLMASSFWEKNIAKTDMIYSNVFGSITNKIAEYRQ